MMIKLTHPDPLFELWIDPSEIIVMERYTRQKTAILTLNDDRPDLTALVLKNGRTMSCKETPDEIMKLMNL